MYSLKEFIQSVAGLSSERIPSNEIFCAETNTELTFITNKMQETLDCYTYTLVDRGWLNLVYNGQELTLQPGDLYIYSPGFQVTILSGSEDYHALCLMADEHITLETPTIWNIIRTAYSPISELGQPVIHLSEAQAAHLYKRMQEIIDYQGSSHRFLEESLRTLYTLFVLDLRDIMELTIGNEQTSERTTNLFIDFIRLLPHHFVEHHDIGFYANVSSDRCRGEPLSTTSTRCCSWKHRGYSKPPTSAWQLSPSAFTLPTSPASASSSSE